MVKSGYGRAVYTAYNERRLDIMNEFVARSPRQLDLCLKLLYDANVAFAVKIRENEKRKIEYVININVDEQTYERLMETYRILIS